MLVPLQIKDQSYNDLKELLLKQYCPRPTTLAERYEFSKTVQRSDEPVNSFLARLRDVGRRCKFTDFESRLLDQFIYGLFNRASKDMLLAKDLDKLTLDEAVERVVVKERSTREAQLMDNRTKGTTSSKEVNKVSKPFVRGKGRKVNVPDNPPVKIQCERCGLRGHRKKECRTRCYKCKKIGHVRNKCTAKSTYHLEKADSDENLSEEEPNMANWVPPSYHVSVTESTGDHEFNSDMKLNSLIDSKINSESELNNNAELDCMKVDIRPMITVFINDKPIDMEFDTGSSVSVCCQSLLSSAGVFVSLDPHPQPLRVANGQLTKVLGRTRVDVRFNDKSMSDLELLVVDEGFPALFGRSWIRQFLGNRWLQTLLESGISVCQLCCSTVCNCMSSLGSVSRSVVVVDRDPSSLASGSVKDPGCRAGGSQRLDIGLFKDVPVKDLAC